MATMTYDDSARRTRFLPRLQWGPIIAGVLVSLACHIVLGLFGMAFGFGAEAADSEGVGAGAGIWGVLTPFVATLLGAWVCVRLLRDDVHDASNYLHGFMVWCIGLIAGAMFLSSVAGGIFSTGSIPGRYIEANRLSKAGSVTRERVQDQGAKAAAATSGAAGVAALFGIVGAVAGAALGRRQLLGQPVFGHVGHGRHMGGMFHDDHRENVATRTVMTERSRVYQPTSDRVTQAGSLSSPAGTGQSAGVYQQRGEGSIVNPSNVDRSSDVLSDNDPYGTHH